MKTVNYEDMIMKKAMNVFADEGLKFFGIQGKVKEIAPTEIVVLETKNMFMDYTFLMEDDTYIHIEFQTTNKGKNDLRRFKTYESLLELQTNKDVVTYVVYSGNIKNPISEYDCGINTYKVKNISMANINGDEVFGRLKQKINDNEEITKHDLIELTFTPIMGGTLRNDEKIVDAIKILKKVDNEYSNDIKSMLYAFANKFLKGKDLEKVKEELKMTELGEMLINEGIEKGLEKGRKEGIEKGIEKGKIEVVKKSIQKGLDNEIIADITGLTIEKIELIREAIS